MRQMKLIGWVVGLSIVGGVASTAPASAELNHASTATNVSGASSVIYGFQPLVHTPTIETSLKDTLGALGAFVGRQGENGIATATRDAVNSLANGGRTGRNGTTSQEANGLVNSPSDRGSGLSIDSADISPETRAALQSLATRLQEMENGLWAYGDAMDRSIQASAKGLSKDLAAAETGCKNGKHKTSECARLNRLVEKTSTFTQRLETLRKNMEQTIQKARIY